MRLVCLIPELIRTRTWEWVTDFFKRHHRLARLAPFDPYMYTRTAHGGTLNIMRHAALVRSLGVEAVLATPGGKDTYGRYNVVDVPFVRWADRRDDDVCVVPDFCTDYINEVRGQAIAYLQIPTHLYTNFDYLSPRVRLWTDSPFMLERCRKVFPGKHIEIVPNIVDDKAFPFIPQAEREPGLLLAFPRKGPEFIDATEREYAALGGKYWRFERIDGIPLFELARRMRRAQAFLASAEVEGCALPPQESMAAGIVVVGKTARGANFSMEHRRTAMVAETPAEAARALVELENPELREHIARHAHEFISRYFPSGEPTQFWLATLRDLGFEAPGRNRRPEIVTPVA
ncbi:MAG: glycosyltransferase [Pseudomonadota bacterium]|nr:MAG: glycosyltransferase family 1 protein [Pseudomonadota bacterium]